MNFLKSNFAPVIILAALVSMQACKSKKMIQKPATVAETPAPAPAPQPTPPPPAPQPTPPPAPSIDINSVKIQFEFDSSVLRTDAYAVLDQVAAAMKMAPTGSYVLNGYASIEGTPEHNMALSQDRANAVKLYLVNAGVSANSITAKGYGTANPVGDNNTEEGRILNRRVEVKKTN
jgi:OOP family OmpA-OmpF porin